MNVLIACEESQTVCKAFREVTTCKDFVLSKFGDVDTGKIYKPRAKKAHKAEDDDNQLSFYKTEETQ